MMLRLKSKEDIRAIRSSGKLLAETFAWISEQITEGMTGLELDAMAKEYIVKRKGKPAFLGYSGFPNTLCISINNAVIHGIPSNKPFKPGDVVSVDCGINLDGYISDMAYSYAIGEVSPAVSKLMKTTEESLYLGIAQAGPDKRVHDISRAVYQHNKAQGYGIVRPYCGHGVGFEVHEDPQVPNYVGGANPRLKVGMVIAIEPMVNLGTDDVYVLGDSWTVVTRDGSISAHYEHTIAIVPEGYEILTQL